MENNEEEELPGRCQVCIMPMSILLDLGEDPEFHHKECVKWHEKTRKNKERECYKGVNCTSTLKGHYRNFTHNTLTQHLKSLKAMKFPNKNKPNTSSPFKSSKRKTPDIIKNTPSKKSKTKSLTSSQSKSKSLTSSQSILKSSKIDSFFSIDSSPKLLDKVPSQSSECLTKYSWHEDVHEVENIVCDIDVSNWNTDIFDDEATVPLECVESSDDSKSDIFKDSSSSSDISSRVGEETNINDLNDEPKTSEDNKLKEAKVIEISDGEEVFEKRQNSSEKWNFLMMKSVKSPKKEVTEVEKSPAIKTQLFSLPNAPVESMKAKKQVSLMSYFGKNSKISSINDLQSTSNVKFVEEKTTVFQSKPSRSKSESHYVFQSANNNEVTSPVNNEPNWKKKRSCPFYKKIPGTTFAVDAFNYGIVPGINHYFLSHFHYDHYQGLTKKFQGKIYCNGITGKLITLKIGIPYAILNILPMEEAIVVDGVEINLLDANHCPGSAMFLFHLPNGQTVLHTGDFRAHTKMQTYPHLIKRNIDVLYLDTTYLNPTYTFPLQEDIINFVVSLAKNNLRSNPKTLFICGSYTIGKERVFIEIAEKLDLKIWASREKLRIFDCLENECLSKRLTSNPNVAQIHVLPMNQLNFKSLQVHLRNFEGNFKSILAVKPTGWEYRAGSSVSTLGNIKPKTSGPISVYGIPYSEHSSYDELKMFVQFLRPKKIIPTVNVGNPKKRNEMSALIDGWMR